MDKILGISEFIRENESRVFVVMDTETTGLSATTADVIEVSAIKARFREDGKIEVLDSFDAYINPGYPLPPAIVAFNQREETGIDDAFLADKPGSTAVARALLSFLRKEPSCDARSEWTLVGHNVAQFDTPFLEKLAAAGNAQMTHANIFDTLLYARSVIPFSGKGTHKLGTLHQNTPQRLFSENPQYHCSLGDCLATLDILEDFCEKARKNVIKWQRPVIDPTSFRKYVAREAAQSHTTTGSQVFTSAKTQTPSSEEANLPPEKVPLRLRFASNPSKDPVNER